MKNNWSLVWNPFTKIAGYQAFLIGFVIAILAAIIGQIGNLFFDGAIDAHGGATQFTMLEAVLMVIIDIVAITFVMYLLSLAVTRNFRFADVLGTMTLARFPFLILSILALFTTFPEVENMLANPLVILSYPSFILFMFISIFIAVWVIILMFNALKVSTGLKKSSLVTIFIVGIIIAELISKILIYHVITKGI
jgi:hypothetical protein